MLAELIVGVGQPAALDGQAATSRAIGEVIAELLEMPYPLIKLRLPALGYPLPVMPGGGGGAAIRQQREHGSHVCQRDPYSLGNANQRHPPQALTLIEVQRRDRHPAARGELPDGELLDGCSSWP